MFMRMTKVKNQSKHEELINKARERLENQNQIIPVNQNEAIQKLSRESSADQFKTIDVSKEAKKILNESKQALAEISSK